MSVVAIAKCRHGIAWAAYVKGYGNADNVAEMVWSLQPGDRIELGTAEEARTTVQVCEDCEDEVSP